MKRLYLDYMATTPIDERVISQMQQYMGFDSHFGNPASQHAYGASALKAIDMAREQVAELINAQAEDIIWTSGATESNNLAIKGACDFYQRKGRHIITVKTEHKAVLDCFAFLEKQGFSVSYLDVDSDGLIDIDNLTANLKKDTILVSVMQVNNETGVLQAIAEIGALLKDKGILFHVDAAQAAGKTPIDVAAFNVDLMSFSAHKVYGPKGAGALYVRQKPRVRLSPLIHGGGHERGLRSGTLATHQIVGMGKAFEIAKAEMNKECRQIKTLQDLFLKELAALPGIKLNGAKGQRVPHNSNISFEGVDGEALIYALSELCVSTASACTSQSIEPSHVLTAMAVSDRLAHSSIRFSFGRYTTEDDVKKAAALVIQQVQRLRALSL